jgi:hypothetical protein
MSLIYQGATQQLIPQPEEQLSVQPSRLAALVRRYCCAESFSTQARQILLPGYVPQDYPLMTLWKKPVESTNGAVRTFECTFYGVLASNDYSVPYVTYGISLKMSTANLNTGTYIVNYTMRYSSPTMNRSYVVPANSTLTLSTPTPATVLNGQNLQIVQWYDNTGTVISQPSGALITPTHVTMILGATRTNYGGVDEVSENFDVSWF